MWRTFWNKTPLSQTPLVVLGALVLVIGLSFNLGSLLTEENQMIRSPESADRQILASLEESPVRTELPSTEEGVSLSLEYVTGKGQPKTVSGTAENSDSIVLEKPDGPQSPAWVEYTVHFSDARYERGIGFYGRTSKDSSRQYSFSVEDRFIPPSEKAELTRKGSFWVVGEENPTVDISGISPGTTWSFTVHSAVDAPVLGPGQSLSGDSAQGPQAFRYTSDRETSVKGSMQPVDAQGDDLSRSLGSGLNLFWTDADDIGSYKVTQQSVMALGRRHFNNPASQPTYSGATALLPGDYLMDTRAFYGQWELEFTEPLPELHGEFPSYKLLEATPIDEQTGTGGANDESEALALKSEPTEPRLVQYFAQGPQAGSTFSIHPQSSRESGGFSATSPWSYDDIHGVQLMTSEEVGKQFKVISRKPWEVKTYGLEALPTYGKGQQLSGTGPILFYFDGSEDTTALLERVYNGDDLGRSPVHVYSAGGQADERSPESWVELYSTTLSAESLGFELKAGKPTLMYMDVTPTVTWRLAL